MTYHFEQTPALRHYGRRGLGDNEENIVFKMFSVFQSRLNEIQAGSDAAVQAQQDAIFAAARPPVSATAPITKTVSGGTAAAAVTAGDFVIKGGVAKPRNLPAMTAAKTLQLQLNRVARAKGFGAIGVDGDIGPATADLANKGSVAAGFGATNTVGSIIQRVEGVTNSVKTFADSLGAPAPSAAQLASAARAGTVVVQTRVTSSGAPGPDFPFKPPGVKASIIDKLNALPDTAKLAGLGALGLGAILLAKKLRGRRGGSSTPALAAPKPTLALASGPTSNPRRRRRRRR